MSLSLSTCTDGELAALTLAGRQAAFAEIMQRHQGAVYRLINRLVNGSDEALDLTQESFASAFKHLATYQQERPMRAWLSRIAINKARDWNRRQRVRRFFSFGAFMSDEQVEGIADEAPSAHDVAVASDEIADLNAALKRLPATLREVLLLRTVEGLSQADTAATLAISGKAVETRLYRARLRLNAILAEGRDSVAF